MIPVAIIQDNMQFVSVLPGIIEKSGHFCVSRIYYFINDALSGLRENPADIVILDMALQHNEVIEWMKEIKNELPGIKWLAYTVHDNSSMLFNALYAGVDGYILKDPLHEQLNNALHELVMGGAPMSPCMANKLINYFHKPVKKVKIQSLLSSREKEILHFTSRGMLYKEVGLQLGINRETVKKHLSKIYVKLQVQNKIEAMNKFYGL
jgi:DNA-binding NarL/FixJ family response regulator